MTDAATRAIERLEVERWGQCPACRHTVATRQSRQEVQLMADPPSTANRWVVTTYWQCLMFEEHRGEFWNTTDEPAAVGVVQGDPQ